MSDDLVQRGRRLSSVGCGQRAPDDSHNEASQAPGHAGTRAAGDGDSGLRSRGLLPDGRASDGDVAYCAAASASLPAIDTWRTCSGAPRSTRRAGSDSSSTSPDDRAISKARTYANGSI